MPAVSVIIPVYNTEEYLKECLVSICNQTFSDIEIICVNDGSTDNSLPVLQDFQKTDSRIRIISFPSNRGVSAARNAGIDAAQGDYISFVDSDDWADKDYFLKLFEEIDRTKYDLVLNTNVLLSCNGEIRPFSTIGSFYSSYFNRNLNPSELLPVEDTLYLSACGNIFRTSIIKLNHIEFPAIGISEDWCFLHIYANCASNIKLFDGAAYYYRTRDTSASHTQNNCSGLVRYYSLLYDIYSRNGWLGKGIKLFNFKYLVSILDEYSFSEAKAFSMKVYDYVHSNIQTYSMCDRLVVDSFSGNLSYSEYEQQYGPDFRKTFVLMALRKNISQGKRKEQI